MPGAPLTTAEDSVLLVQITDSHLFAEADGRLLGLDTHDSLGKVVDLVLAEQPVIDLALATGDLSQDGSVASISAFACSRRVFVRRFAGARATTTN